MTKLSSLSTDQLLNMCCDFLAQEGVEGLRLKSYSCQAGKPTIGIGCTYYTNGNPVKLGDTCTKEQAYEWCKTLIKMDFLSPVNKYYNKIPDAETFVALVSFTFNYRGKLGDSLIEALKESTLDKQKLAAAFRLYNKFTNPKTGQKEVSKGLINRREIEIKYLMEVK